MPTNCVWLDNVDQTVQENFLSRQFGRYGQVTHGIIDRIKGKALVYFTNAEQAQYALVEMRNRILNNKKIMVSLISYFFVINQTSCYLPTVFSQGKLNAGKMFCFQVETFRHYIMLANLFPPTSINLHVL